MIFHQSQNSLTARNYNSHIYKRLKWQPHFHRNFEVVCVFRGCIKATIGGKDLILRPNDFALVLSNEVHQYEPLEESRAWVGVFSGDYVPVFQKTVEGKTGDTSCFHCEDSILQYLKVHLFHNDTPDFHYLTAGLNMLCGEYLHQVTLSARSNRENIMMNRAADYIAQNFRKPLTLSEVAQALGYDYYYFSKNFHNIFGVCFNDYLNTFRFNAAAEALLRTNDSITSIALDSGFQSIRSFNNVFQKKAGMTPSQYRKSAALPKK
ncbi:MAG: helix-turn-helix domain-containing protein [Oscillospiraceae bacterium]|nr:helix-turn-helix domain-containing protein [Oscillospiraceae bacterium]